MDEVNRILQTQEANLTYSEIESYVSQSQDALYSYLLGLQEETFMGIPTAELVDIVRDLDPMQHLQIGVDANGTTTIEIIKVTKLPSLWEKIATSLVCAFGIVGGFVCSAVGCPVIGGALIGASMEVFSQVVISNTPVSDIQWAQVAVATVSGAIAGGVSGAINGIATKGVGQLIMKEVADTLCDSVIGGGEFFVNSLIAGCSFEEACKNFGYGVIAGAVISGGIKIGSAAIKGGAKLIKKVTTSTVSDVGGKQLTKLGNEAAEDSISELQEKTMQKNAAKNSNEFAEHISCKNKKYAGKTYDFDAQLKKAELSNDPNDWATYNALKQKYPNGVPFVEDINGNVFPNFDEYVVLEYDFAPVTVENLKSGTCLVGDSTSGSPDFKMFRQRMLKDGYTQQEIAELLSTHTIHHHPNTRTLQLVPRDVHSATGHTGGAALIRQLIKNLLGG